MGLLSRLLTAFAEALTDPPPKRTLCCNVVMFDVWQHDEKCPQLIEKLGQLRGRGLPRLRKGDHSTKCPTCGWPTGFYGLYIVGKTCPYCGYVERRCV